MSDESTQTAGADAERGMRRQPKKHYISGMRASSTRRSLLGALAFDCALVGPNELGSLASAPDGGARISAEHRRIGSNLPTRIHAFPGLRLRLYRTERR